MMIRGFFTTFLMKQRLGILGLGKASFGFGLFFYLHIKFMLLAPGNHLCTEFNNCTYVFAY